MAILRTKIVGKVWPPGFEGAATKGALVVTPHSEVEGVLLIQGDTDADKVVVQGTTRYEIDPDGTIQENGPGVVSLDTPGLTPGASYKLRLEIDGQAAGYPIHTDQIRGTSVNLADLRTLAGTPVGPDLAQQAIAARDEAVAAQTAAETAATAAQSVDVSDATSALNQLEANAVKKADAGAPVNTTNLDGYSTAWVLGGRVTEMALGEDGRVPGWVLAAWQARMSVGTAWDVWVVAGQSNSTDADPLPYAVEESDPRLLHVPVTATTTELMPAEWMSPGATFAREHIRRTVPGRKLVMVRAGWGATGFRCTSLDPAPAGYATVPNGTWDRTLTSDPKNLANSMVSRVQTVMAGAPPGSRLAGVIWSQGENDRSLMTEAEYAAALDDLIAHTRSAWNVPDLPWLIGSLTPEIMFDGADQTGVPKALIDTPRRVRRTAYVTGPRDLHQHGAGGRVHWNAYGQRERGRRYADAVLRAIANDATAEPVHPQNLRVRRSGDTARIEWDAPPTRYTLIEVQTSIDGGATWQNVTLAGPIVLDATVTVAAATPLRVRARATNDVGVTDWSMEVHA